MVDSKGRYIKGEKHSPENLEKKAEGMEGNQNATKLSTPELKKEAYRQYCAHIASGVSKEAFVFDHPTIMITSRTMEKYIREEPTEFPIEHKQVAEAKSLMHWLDLGKQMMLGRMKKCQPAIYQMFMRNKFGWDKETYQSHSTEPEVRLLLNKWKSQETPKAPPGEITIDVNHAATIIERTADIKIPQDQSFT